MPKCIGGPLAGREVSDRGPYWVVKDEPRLTLDEFMEHGATDGPIPIAFRTYTYRLTEWHAKSKRVLFYIPEAMTDEDFVDYAYERLR